MTSPYLIADLERDEGFRSAAYPDPLSGGDPWTYGFGFTGPGIGPGSTITLADAKTELARRVGALTAELTEHLPWFRSLSDPRQDCLVNLAFNVGLAGLLAFHNTISFIERGDYVSAAGGMLNSRWATQVGARAHRLAEQMKTGTHQA